MKQILLLSGFMAGAALISGCGEKNDPLRELPLKIIGITEPVFLEPFKTPFPAKIDTGADIASLDAKEIQEFVRDGKPYVAFTVVQRKTGTKHRYELPVKRKVPITRHGSAPQIRYVVLMTVKLGNLNLNREFTLADRHNFEYQILIGRNIISGTAAVDPSKSNTLAR